MAAEGLRPILARDTPPRLARLLEAAWQLQPEQRPTAAQLESEMRSIVVQLSSSSPSHAPAHHDQATNGISTGISDASQLPSVLTSDPHTHPYHKELLKASPGKSTVWVQCLSHRWGGPAEVQWYAFLCLRVAHCRVRILQVGCGTKQLQHRHQKALPSK